MINEAIGEALEDMATLLELDGANPFRIQAYRNAVWTIRDHPKDIKELLDAGYDLSELSGIGKDLANNIRHFVEHGELATYAEVARRIPPTLLQLRSLSGLGPKKIRRLWQELGVVDLESLKLAAQNGRIRELDGFGQKSEERILSQVVRQLDAERNQNPG